jgi:hypothetical protein
MGIRERVAHLERSAGLTNFTTLIVVAQDDVLSEADEAAVARAEAEDRPVVVINVISPDGYATT